MGKDLFDLVIGDGDAAGSPVTLDAIADGDLVRLAVNHDVSARADTHAPGRLAVMRLGIVDAKRQVIGAVAVQPVDAKNAFGGAAVAFTAFVTIWRKAKRDAKGPGRSAFLIDGHPAGSFFDQNALYGRGNGRLGPRWRALKDRRQRDMGQPEFGQPRPVPARSWRLRTARRRQGGGLRGPDQPQPPQQRRKAKHRKDRAKPLHCRSRNASCSRPTASMTRARWVAILNRRKFSPPVPKVPPWLAAIRAPCSTRRVNSARSVPVPEKSTHAR